MLSKTISSKPYTVSEYLKKLSRYGYLVKVLSQRELKVKYSRTFLGIGWFFLQPVAVVFVYSIFFKYLVHVNSDNIPYPPFVFSGLVLWYLFTGIVSKGTYALVESGDLINKIPFPRLIVIVSKVVPVILECVVLLILLLIIAIGAGYAPGLNWLSVLFYFILVTIFSFTIGLMCSTIAVKFRDLAHMIPLSMNFGIWLTPVFYPVSIIPQPYRGYLLHLNPIAACIEGLRGALFFNVSISPSVLFTFVILVSLLFMAFYYFVKFEKKIVENL